MYLCLIKKTEWTVNCQNLEFWKISEFFNGKWQNRERAWVGNKKNGYQFEQLLKVPDTLCPLFHLIVKDSYNTYIPNENPETQTRDVTYVTSHSHPVAEPDETLMPQCGILWLIVDKVKALHRAPYYIDLLGYRVVWKGSVQWGCIHLGHRNPSGFLRAVLAPATRALAAALFVAAELSITTCVDRLTGEHTLWNTHGSIEYPYSIPTL